MMNLNDGSRSEEKQPGSGYHLQIHAIELPVGLEVAHERKERSGRNFH